MAARATLIAARDALAASGGHGNLRGATNTHAGAELEEPFDRLLRVLGDEHHREVRKLREKIRQLNEGGASNSCAQQQEQTSALLAPPQGEMEDYRAAEDEAASPAMALLEDQDDGTPDHFRSVAWEAVAREVSAAREATKDSFAWEDDEVGCNGNAALVHGSTTDRPTNGQPADEQNAAGFHRGSLFTNGDGEDLEIDTKKEPEAIRSLDSIRTNGDLSMGMTGWKMLMKGVERRMDADVGQDGYLKPFIPQEFWMEAMTAAEEIEKNEGTRKYQMSTLVSLMKKPSVSVYSKVARQSFSDKCLGVWSRFTIHPNSGRRMWWDFVGALLLLYDFIMIPLAVFSTATLDWKTDDFLAWQEAADLLGVIFWTVDTGVGFLTGYYSAHGVVELNPPSVALHYLRGWFILDGMIIGIDWAAIIFHVSGTGSVLRIGKTASRIMRVFRLLRFIKLSTAMKDMFNTFSEYTHAIVGLVKILLFIVFLNHYIACLWYGIGALMIHMETEEALLGRTWVQQHLINKREGEDLAMSYAYSTSLHWSLTQFTPASMEVYPMNAYERAYNIVVIIMALCVFSSFVSSITATMTRIREINNQLAEQEASLRSFFAEHHISLGLAKQVFHYLKFHGKPVVEKRKKLENVPVLTFLPEALKQELRMEIFLPILHWHPLFRDAHLTQEGLSKLVNETISEKSLRMNEPLFPDWRIEGVKHMGFVAAGGLLYNDGKFEPILADAGSWVCEAALWIEDAELEWPLVARTAGTEVVLLNGEKLQDIIRKNNGQTLKLFAQYAAHFCEAFNVVMTEQMTDISPLFNDPALIEDLTSQSAVAGFMGRSRTFVWRSQRSGTVGRFSFRKSTNDAGITRKTILSRLSRRTRTFGSTLSASPLGSRIRTAGEAKAEGSSLPTTSTSPASSIVFPRESELGVEPEIGVEPERCTSRTSRLSFADDAGEEPVPVLQEALEEKLDFDQKVRENDGRLEI